VLSLVAIPGFGLLSLLAHDIVPLLFGARWAEAAPVLAIYALAGIPFGAVHFLQVAPIALGRSGSYFHITAVTAACVVVGALIGVQRGLEAVAVSGVLAECVQVVLVLRNSRDLLNISPRQVLASQRVPLIVAVLALSAAALAQLGFGALPAPWRLLATLTAFGLTYITGLWTLSPDALTFVRELRGARGSTASAGAAAGD